MKFFKVFLFITSLILVSFGNRVWIAWFSFFTSFLGFSFLWLSLKDLSKKRIFWFSYIWFCLVSFISLSWMTSIKYQGIFILLVLTVVVIALGFQFAFFSKWILHDRQLKLKKILMFASLWTLFEWGRLFVLCGFSWNPVGMILASNEYSIQLASVLGVYGLSFYVIFVNLLGYKSFINKKLSNYIFWIIAGIFPYLFGFFNQSFWTSKIKTEDKLNIALVQPALTPEEKEPLPKYLPTYLHPLKQWDRIFSLLRNNIDKSVDLIVLPESSVSFGARIPLHFFEDFLVVWKKNFEKEINFHFSYPFSQISEDQSIYLSNSFGSKALADYFNADVIAGFDDYEFDKKKGYNAAFYYSANSSKYQRYEKQILLPIVEYLPFKWLTEIAKQYGINGSFSQGKEMKVFKGKVPMSLCICYEETFGNLIRHGRKKGAKLLVNISNDVWFPNSKLPMQHLEHGRLRAVENGVPLVRSCNTGVTAAIDCFGKDIKRLQNDKKQTTDMAGILVVDVFLQDYPTIYTMVGDYLIITLSLIFIILNLVLPKNKFLANFL